MKTYTYKFSYIKYISLIIIAYLISINYVQVKAEVHFKQVDTTLSAKVLMEVKNYELDINDDGIKEYMLDHAYQDKDWKIPEVFSEKMDYGNEILTDINNVPVIINEADEISASLSDWTDSWNGGNGHTARYINNGWQGMLDKYIAVRFKINGSFRYGWIKISVPADSNSLIIKSCAYEDTPDKSIKAGDNGTSVSDLLSFGKITIYNLNKTLVVNLDETKSGGTVAEIYDLYGNFLRELKLENVSNIIQLDKYNAGIYFIVLKHSSGIIRHRFILY